MTTTNSKNRVTTLLPSEAMAGMQAGELVLIDVRTGVEFAGVHAEGAEHYPLDEMNAADVIRKYPGKTICCICRSGSRGAQAAAQLLAAGSDRVANVAGGTNAWEQAGLPVHNRSVISLERQIRIVAGLIVIIGAVLAYFVHPYFVGVCAFVGAGLIFAGITDFCGIGLLIAKMPWNRYRSEVTNAGPQACRV